MADCRAIIFDFDGVIVESDDIKTSAFIDLYREHGPAVVATAVAHHQANGGISRRKKIRYIHREYLGVDLCEEELTALCLRFSRLVEDAVAACDWVEGAEGFVRAHRGRVPLFVVSGTPHEELARIVEKRGMSSWFTDVFGSPPEKPTTIRRILSRYSLNAEEVVFVGDALSDYSAARETGLRFIGRVAPGRPSPFPADTKTIPHLAALNL